MVNKLIDLELRKQLRHPEKVKNPINPIKRKPNWIRVKAPNSSAYHETRSLMQELELTTVCEEAACPWMETGHYNLQMLMDVISTQHLILT